MSNETALDLDAAMKLVEKHATVAVSGSPFMSSWHAERVAYARGDFRQTVTPEVVVGIINQRDAAIARAEVAEAKVAAVEALAESLEQSKVDCGSCSQRLSHAARLRNIITPPVDARTCGCHGIPQQVCDECQGVHATLAGEDA